LGIESEIVGATSIGHAAMKRTTHSTRKSSRQAFRAELVSCKDATHLIGDYLADNLKADERRAFETHLTACPDCAAFLSTYKRTIALTRSFLAQNSLQAPPVEFKLRLPSAR
jgi:anti-sigma factor RsiW